MTLSTRMKRALLQVDWQSMGDYKAFSVHIMVAGWHMTSNPFDLLDASETVLIKVSSWRTITNTGGRVFLKTNRVSLSAVTRLTTVCTWFVAAGFLILRSDLTPLSLPPPLYHYLDKGVMPPKSFANMYLLSNQKLLKNSFKIQICKPTILFKDRLVGSIPVSKVESFSLSIMSIVRSD